MNVRSRLVLLSGLVALGVHARAHAQTADEEGTHQEDAVDPAAAAAAEEAELRRFDFQWAGGVNLTTGNAQSLSGNTGLTLDWRELQHSLRFATLATVGYAVPRDEPASDDLLANENRNALNVIGRLRYDFFVTDDDALFVAVWGRHDPFANIDFRFQTQVGYARNLYRAEKVRFWAELGYDLTLDWEIGVDDPMTPDVDEAAAREADNPYDQHSVRAFLGYDNAINAVLSYRTGFEALFDVTNSNNYRFFWTNTLTSKVDDLLSLQLNFALIFDKDPVPGAERLDTITSFAFVFDII